MLNLLEDYLETVEGVKKHLPRTTGPSKLTTTASTLKCLQTDTTS
ncbi:unnamed protein product [Oncorhynchus mykiss]|uniref:Uncharacterized protein n=1 Tax=Oncorhynchus mykiss TaxID=8022 RepID=A0A060X392_ONCMY|nr:unnamed protein product [Oncorhynchus mykiss]